MLMPILYESIRNRVENIVVVRRRRRKTTTRRKKRDPIKGTGKKPKGSGRRLYTDENPKDTVRIKFATVKNAKATVRKVKRVRKSYARKIQILTVLEQRSKFGGKPEQARLAKAAKKTLKAAHERKKTKHLNVKHVTECINIKNN